MATRKELMGGLQFVPAQARRVAGMLDELGQWDSRRPAGWCPKEMFTHVAVVAGTIPKMGRDMLSAPPEADIIAGMDMAAVNEQGVASMRSMDAKDVLAALDANYVKLSDWVKSLSDEQLESRHTFRSTPMKASDMIMTLVVMHAIHDLFEAPLPDAL